MQSFALEVVTPDRAHPARDVVFLDVPAEGGRLTVLAHHQPLVCYVRGGEAAIEPAGGERERWTLGPGVLTVHANTATLVVRDAARSA